MSYLPSLEVKIVRFLSVHQRLSSLMIDTDRFNLRIETLKSDSKTLKYFLYFGYNKTSCDIRTNCYNRIYEKTGLL